MKNPLKKLICLLLPVTVVLSSCGDAGSSEALTDYRPNISIAQEDFDDLEFEDAKEVYFENPDILCNTYKDVDPDFVITLEGKGHTLMETPGYEDFTLSDTLGEAVEHVSLLTGSGGLTVTAKDGYKPGQAYVLTLNNDNLRFAGRDDSIREVYFTIKDEAHNEMDLVAGIPTYDLSKVTYNTGADYPHPYLTYSGSFGEEVGAVVSFQSDDPARKNDAIFIKVAAIQGQNIYYEMPDTDEVFENLSIHVDDASVPMEESFHLNSKEEIYEEIMHSDLVLDYVALTAYRYNFESSAIDFLKSAKIDVGFHFVDSGISLKAVICLTHKFESGWALSLNITFTWTETLSISATAETETFLGVPYWVTMNVSAAKDDKFSVSAAVVFTHSTFNPGPEWEDPDRLDPNSAKRAVEQLKDKWKDSGMFDTKREKTESGTTLFNIGWIEFYLGYVSFSIDFYLCMAANISITLGAGWTYDSHTVIVEFSTSGDNPGGGSGSPSKVRSSVINGEGIGKFNFEFFLRLRLSFFITGLKWLAALYLDLDGGVYLSINGFGGVSYDIVNDVWNADIGFLIELGLKLTVSIGFSILDHALFHWDVFDLRKPLIKVGNTDRIEDRVSGDIHLGKKETKIDDTNLLAFTVMDGLTMSTSVKTFHFNDKMTIIDSIFMGDPVGVRLVDSLTSSSEYLRIEDGKFVIAEGAPNAFDATLTLKISNALSFISMSFTVNVHYVNENAHYASFDGTNRVPLLPGEEVIFPAPETRDGQIFKGWLLDGEKVDLSKPFLMPDRDVNFESRYIQEIYFNVEFYDGFNNLICTVSVLNEDAAEAPDPATRDARMEGYSFVRWDKDFSSVTDHMKVRGIYARISEVAA